MFRRGIRLWVGGAILWTAFMTGQDSLKRLSKSQAVNAVVSKVPPDYPAVAKQLKMQGTVELEAVISTEGTVAEVHIVSGNPVLTKAAVEAVKKWKFTPVMEDGKPARAVAPISLEFKM
jgi:periplasmic protein TonB